MQQRGESSETQHIFIIGSKSIGQYGGYETFVERLLTEHENLDGVKYHVACKANGEGYMDESRLSDIEVIKQTTDGKVTEFTYRNAHVFKISCPQIGPAVAIYYDRAALLYSIQYCKDNNIQKPIFYILTCRIGLFISDLKKQIKDIGGFLALNPDGHEFLRAKWPLPVRKYWKWSEKKMVFAADMVICDSVNIEKYIREEYGHKNTRYISYGADVESSELGDSNQKFGSWLKENGLESNSYYLVVGRFVPENNYETVIREFMKSNSVKDFILITNMNDKLKNYLDKTLNFSSDSRIKFVGPVYDKELLAKIRKNAYAYLHGHEVGGTNPSLLESLGSTDVNLLLSVGFNREVAQESALYWNKEDGNLSRLIDEVDSLDLETRKNLGNKAKERVKTAYSWQFIGDEYKKVWNEVGLNKSE